MSSPIPASGFPIEPVIARLGATPAVQRVPNPKLTLFIRKAFLEPELCARLMGKIDADRRPSTISDSNGDAVFRTSETCDLPNSDPDVLEVERRVAALTGIDSMHGEPLQGQRYDVGQEFKAHTDYFEPQGIDYDKYCAVAGQRTWQ